MEEYMVPLHSPHGAGRKFFIDLGQRAVARDQAGL